MLPENQAAVTDHSTAAPSAVATDVQTATSVATVAAGVATAVAPIEVQAAPSGSENTVLGLEQMFGKIASVIPGLSAFAGFTIPAEVATHAAYSLFHWSVAMFHLGKAHQKASAAPPKQ